MRQHIRILGILNIIMGCLTALAGVAVLLITGGAAHFMTYAGVSDSDAALAAPLLATVGVGIGLFFVILAAPSLIGGLGLLNFRPWARILMIIVSIFHLLHPPLGTALGVYGLWVLFHDESRRWLGGGAPPFQPIPGSYPLSATPPHATYPPQPPSAL